MTIDWALHLAKKAELQKPTPTIQDLAELEQTAAEVLQVPINQRATTWGLSLGYGMRTKTLIATHRGVDHRYVYANPQVVAKLYRGPATDFVAFHDADTRYLTDVLGRPEFQLSIAGGVLPTGEGFAILEYVEGQTLKSWLGEKDRCNTAEPIDVIRELFYSIWIPVWNSGLRFKDCHSGNFIVKSFVPRLVMIDCEQMRKSAAEFLRDKDNWKQRDAHEASALRRLPNLIESFSLSWKPEQNKASLKRLIRAALQRSELNVHLSALGRTSNDTTGPARQAIEEFIEAMIAANAFPRGEQK